MSSFNNSTSQILLSTANCKVFQVLGSYCVLLFAASIVSNSRLVYVFMTKRSLLTPINFILFILTIVNLVGTLIELPLVGYNAYMCMFMYSAHMCSFMAFTMYFIGCFSISSTVAISALRYIIAHYCLIMQPINWECVVWTVSISALISFVFSIMPFFGWSNYTIEGVISCSVEWKMRTLNIATYNLTIFALFFIIPIITLVFTNVRLVMIYRKSRNNFIECHTAKQLKRSYAEEKKLKAIGSILITGFIVSWTPYAVVSLTSAFIDLESISPLLVAIPGLFAKSSLLWPSFIFLISGQSNKKGGAFMRKSTTMSITTSHIQIHGALNNEIECKEFMLKKQILQ